LGEEIHLQTGFGERGGPAGTGECGDKLGERIEESFTGDGEDTSETDRRRSSTVIVPA
jgi:hypothetical protein